MSPSRYDKPVDLTELNNPHSLAILLVPPGATVLDVGAASGGVARELTARGCTVYGVEIDDEAAKDAEPHCARVVVGDVEKLDLRAELGDVSFDAVLLIDVLEHLVDPTATLRRCAELLGPNGIVVTSLPHVAHAAVRLQLLQGSFEYSETGLLDKTHLRFFDRANVDQLFADAGLSVLHQLRVTAPLDGTEIQLDWDSFSPETIAEATSDPEATTFQFVTVAVAGDRPASPDPDATLLATLHRRVLDATDTIAGGMSYARQLESELAAKDAWAADLEGRVTALEQTLRERMAELNLAHEQLHALKLDLAVKDQYVAELRGDPRPPLRVSAQAGYVLVDRTYARLERHPRMLRAARWFARRAASRRGE